MEERTTSWHPVSFFINWLERQDAKYVMLEELNSSVHFQRLNVIKSLDAVAKTYMYKTRTLVVTPDIADIVDTTSLECELFVLRSLIADYTRARHWKSFQKSAFREYVQYAAVTIGERFIKDFPKTKRHNAIAYVDHTHVKLYNQLVVNLVNDILLSPMGYTENETSNYAAH